MVAVAPTIDRPLDETPLAPQGGVQLRESPSDAVAVGLIHQTVTTVLILVAASARVDTVLLLELLLKSIRIDRLDVAANGVFHFDTVPRVLESNPLNAIAILPDD